VAWSEAVAAGIAANMEYLTQPDSDIGDADHGTNMDRGFKAVAARLPSVADDDIGIVLKTVGRTLVSTVGGRSAHRTARSSCKWARWRREGWNSPWRTARQPWKQESAAW
jgi:DAK2 domain